MDERNFEVGLRIQMIKYNGDLTPGATGNIVSMKHKNIAMIGVEFDLPMSDGHDCDETAKEMRGRWVSFSEVEIIEEKEY